MHAASVGRAPIFEEVFQSMKGAFTHHEEVNILRADANFVVPYQQNNLNRMLQRYMLFLLNSRTTVTSERVHDRRTTADRQNQQKRKRRRASFSSALRERVYIVGG